MTLTEPRELGLPTAREPTRTFAAARRRLWEIEMEQSNVIRFPGSGCTQDPDALAAMRGLVGEPQWRRDGRGGWWLTVIADGVCAHARLRQEASGRWSGSMSRTRRHGWRHEKDIDAGDSLLAALRTAERAIARLAASPV